MLNKSAAFKVPHGHYIEAQKVTHLQLQKIHQPAHWKRTHLGSSQMSLSLMKKQRYTIKFSHVNFEPWNKKKMVFKKLTSMTVNKPFQLSTYITGYLRFHLIDSHRFIDDLGSSPPDPRSGWVSLVLAAWKLRLPWFVHPSQRFVKLRTPITYSDPYNW